MATARTVLNLKVTGSDFSPLRDRAKKVNMSISLMTVCMNEHVPRQPLEPY